jgi:hypothetical protein
MAVTIKSTVFWTVRVWRESNICDEHVTSIFRIMRKPSKKPAEEGSKLLLLFIMETPFMFNLLII